MLVGRASRKKIKKRKFFHQKTISRIFCWRSWTSCLDTWHHWFYQIPTDKKSISDWLCYRNLIMGHVWIFQPDNNPKTNLKTTQKWVTGTKPSFCYGPFQFPDLHPIENEWVELKRRSTNMELWIWRIWRDSGWRNGLWSHVRCSLTSSGIIGEKLLYYFGKWRFQKVLNKRVPLIVSNVY